MIHRTVHTYDQRNREVKRVGYSADGGRVYSTNIEYHTLQSGREVHTATFGSGDELLNRGVGRFDEHERIVETLALGPDGDVEDRQVWSYADEEQKVHYTRWNAKGEVIEAWTRNMSG